LGIYDRKTRGGAGEEKEGNRKRSGGRDVPGKMSELNLFEQSLKVGGMVERQITKTLCLPTHLS
jgi:hypothetical protein